MCGEVAQFQAWRAVAPDDGGSRWVVVDADYVLHVEATAFLAGLRAADRSVNTERVYAGRVALYLSYCAARGIDWRRPNLLHLGDFLHWLTREPLPPKGCRPRAEPRFRSPGTANAVVTAVGEFLRFCTRHGWAPSEVAAQLSQPKFLRYLPPGYDPGEDGQFRTVHTAAVRFRVAVEGYEWLAAEQVQQLIRFAGRARDRFLVALLGCAGMRIGEALGLRREDMHLLASSTSLGCRVAGPHVHVRRRQNANGALAKTRSPRAIPVTVEVVDYYADYVHERDQVPQARSCDFVFVNLFRSPLGQPLRYGSARDLFDRLAKRAGFPARPHMLRHSAATAWIRAGVGRDVVQHLLGHVSPVSMEPYLHVSDADKRAAVERVAAQRAGRG